jgi:hypothetical protein
LAAAALAVAPFACSTPATLLATGSDCTQTTDCQDGLFCVQQPMGPSICSANFASIVSTEEAGADGGSVPPEEGEGGAPGGDGAGGGGDTTAPPAEGGSSPDVKTAPPDTGTTKEAQPPQEASPPPEAAPDVARETGTSRPDASADDAAD